MKRAWSSKSGFLAAGDERQGENDVENSLLNPTAPPPQTRGPAAAAAAEDKGSSKRQQRWESSILNPFSGIESQPGSSHHLHRHPRRMRWMNVSGRLVVGVGCLVCSFTHSLIRQLAPSPSVRAGWLGCVGNRGASYIQPLLGLWR